MTGLETSFPETIIYDRSVCSEESHGPRMRAGPKMGVSF